MGSIITWIFIIGLVYCFSHYDKVPPYTVIIVDKDGHYYKTYRHGIYPKSGHFRATTKISTKPLSATLFNYYETHDGRLLSITVNCIYHSQNIEQTLVDLQNVRRSINDIIQSSVYAATKKYELNYLMRNRNEFYQTIKTNLARELDAVSVKLNTCGINGLVEASESMRLNTFKPHVSGCINSDNTPHPHEYAIKTNEAVFNKDDDNPIKFY